MSASDSARDRVSISVLGTGWNSRRYVAETTALGPTELAAAHGR